MRRITLGGSDFANFEVQKPCEWAKVFIPRAEGATKNVGRAYTLRNPRLEQGEFDIDVLLHGTGPMSDWAAKAQPGDAAFVAGPRGGYEPGPECDSLVLVGDLSALPAIATILERAASTVTTAVFAMVNDAADLQVLPEANRSACRWTSGDAETLLRLLRDFQVPPGRTAEVWGAGEARLAKSLRDLFLKDRALPKARVHCVGYWKLGQQDHRDSESPS